MKKLIDKHLEEEMDTVLTVVTLGRAARNAANIKNRQPISKIMVKGDKTLELCMRILSRMSLTSRKSAL